MLLRLCENLPIVALDPSIYTGWNPRTPRPRDGNSRIAVGHVSNKLRQKHPQADHASTGYDRDQVHARVQGYAAGADLVQLCDGVPGKEKAAKDPIAAHRRPQCEQHGGK